MCKCLAARHLSCVASMWMLGSGGGRVACPYIKTPIPCQSSTQIRKTGQIPVVMETSSVRVTLPSLWQALPLQRQVKWKTANSHSPAVSHYIWTSPTTRRHFRRLASISPYLSHNSTHLMQTKPARLSPCSLKESPNANLGKLFIVCRQLPPGVLVSQKALQMQREISFLIFFSIFLKTEEKHMQMWECS